MSDHPHPSSRLSDGRRFQINPGPLKVVPESRRRPHARPGDFAGVGRCEANLRDGSGRCLYDGKTVVNGLWVCGIHARSAAFDEEQRR